jgi:hypothetical protein
MCAAAADAANIPALRPVTDQPFCNLPRRLIWVGPGSRRLSQSTSALPSKADVLDCDGVRRVRAMNGLMRCNKRARVFAVFDESSYGASMPGAGAVHHLIFESDDSCRN